MNVLSEIHLAVARGFSALHSVFGRRYPGSFGFVEKCYDFCEKPSLTAEDGLAIDFSQSSKYTLTNGEMTEMAEGARLLSECTG